MYKTHTVSHYILDTFLGRIILAIPFSLLVHIGCTFCSPHSIKFTHTHPFPFVRILSMNVTQSTIRLASLKHLSVYRKLHIKKDDTISLVGNYRGKKEKTSVKQNGIKLLRCCVCERETKRTAQRTSSK